MSIKDYCIVDYKEKSYRKYYFCFYKLQIRLILIFIIAGPDCKIRWVSLRDQFRKVLRKKKTRQEQVVVPVKKWKYEDLFAFLLPFIKERQHINNFDVDSDSNDNRFNVSNEEAINKEQIHFETENRNFNSENQSGLQQNVDDSRNNEIEIGKLSPIDSFFVAISATVKQFSPYYQNIAKSKIFSIVSELEMVQIVNNDNAVPHEILAISENIDIKQSPTSTPTSSPTTPKRTCLAYFKQTPNVYNDT